MTIEELRNFKIEYKERMRVLTCSCLIEGLAFIEIKREEEILSETTTKILEEIEENMREALEYRSVTHEI